MIKAYGHGGNYPDESAPKYPRTQQLTHEDMITYDDSGEFGDLPPDDDSYGPVIGRDHTTRVGGTFGGPFLPQMAQNPHMMRHQLDHNNRNQQSIGRHSPYNYVQDGYRTHGNFAHLDATPVRTLNIGVEDPFKPNLSRDDQVWRPQSLNFNYKSPNLSTKKVWGKSYNFANEFDTAKSHQLDKVKLNSTTLLRTSNAIHSPKITVKQIHAKAPETSSKLGTLEKSPYIYYDDDEGSDESLPKISNSINSAATRENQKLLGNNIQGPKKFASKHTNSLNPFQKPIGWRKRTEADGKIEDKTREILAYYMEKLVKPNQHNIKSMASNATKTLESIRKIYHKPDTVKKDVWIPWDQKILNSYEAAYKTHTGNRPGFKVVTKNGKNTNTEKYSPEKEKNFNAANFKDFQQQISSKRVIKKSHSKPINHDHVVRSSKNLQNNNNNVAKHSLPFSNIPFPGHAKDFSKESRPQKMRKYYQKSKKRVLPYDHEGIEYKSDAIKLPRQDVKKPHHSLITLAKNLKDLRVTQATTWHKKVKIYTALKIYDHKKFTEKPHIIIAIPTTNATNTAKRTEASSSNLPVSVNGSAIYPLFSAPKLARHFINTVKRSKTAAPSNPIDINIRRHDNYRIKAEADETHDYDNYAKRDNDLVNSYEIRIPKLSSYQNYLAPEVDKLKQNPKNNSENYTNDGKFNPHVSPVSSISTIEAHQKVPVRPPLILNLKCPNRNAITTTSFTTDGTDKTAEPIQEYVHICHVNRAYKIGLLLLKEQFSYKDACTAGQNYGVTKDRKAVWVSGTCQAWFQILS